MSALAQQIAARWKTVTAQVAAAAAAAGRDAESVRVIAVSKRHSFEAVLAARSIGVQDMGENYVQEMTTKVADGSSTPAHDVRWHFIGHLQRNKVRQLVGKAFIIHAVDSESLAKEIGKRAAQVSLIQPILLAVNVAGESQKSGVSPAELPALLAAVAEMKNLECRGLMTMPPWPDTAEDSRPYFRDLRLLRDRVRSSQIPLDELSMGTSGDLEVAVQEGATMVRVGTAIFGPRPTPGA